MLYAFAAVCGLLAGSLAGAAIYRLPRGQTLLRPARSRCTACGRTLTAPDLAPLFSYLLLRGRCRSCGAKVSPAYPAAEALTAALFCACVWRMGLSYSAAAVWGLCFCLVCLSFIDAASGILPDGLTIAACVFGIAYIAARCSDAASTSPLYDGLIGAAIFSAPIFLIDGAVRLTAKKEAFGMGDVKLAAACGLFLRPDEAALALLAAVIAGGLFGAALMALGKIRRGGHMPFGPFIAAGTLVSLWFGRDIMAWYLGLIGM